MLLEAKILLMSDLIFERLQTRERQDLHHYINQSSRVFDHSVESAVVFMFDDAHNQIGYARLPGKYQHTVNIPMRDLAYLAIGQNCKSLLLMHNHPSGSSQPSRADIAQTRDLIRLFRKLDIDIDDHIIVAPTENFSFRSHGMI
jgi:DNA repair protein RadC